MFIYFIWYMFSKYIENAKENYALLNSISLSVH